MRVVLVTGTLGSGKTTFLLHLLAANQQRELRKPMLLVNDVGRLNVDADRLAAAGHTASVTDMTSGCLDCADREAFEKAIMGAVDSDDDLFIEPTGAANGDNLNEIFTACGLKPLIVTLLSAAHFERNRAFDAKNMESQVRHASAIGISWCGESSVSDAAPELLRYVGHHALNAPLYLVAEDGLPEDLVATVLHSQAEVTQAHVCGHDCAHHDHDHNHGHSHDHLASYAHSIALGVDTSPEAVRDVCDRLTADYALVRAKGTFGDQQGFDFVHGDLSFTTSASPTRSANFISGQPIPPEALSLIDNGDLADEPLAPQAVIAAIEYGLANAWSALMPNGDIREDNAFLFRALGHSFRNAWFEPEPNPDVPAQLRKTVVERYTDWYLEVAEQLVQGSWNGHVKLSQWQRRVGSHLTLLAINFEDLLGKSRVQQIINLKMAHVTMTGLQGFQAEHVKFMQVDPVEDPDRLIRVARFGIEREELERATVHSSFKHCSELHGRLDWREMWQKPLYDL